MPPKPNCSDCRKRDAAAHSGGDGGGGNKSDADCSLDANEDTDDGGRRVHSRRASIGESERGVAEDAANASTTVAVAVVAADTAPEPSVDRVHATIETRWVRPLVALLRDFRVTKFALRFSDAGCTCLFLDNPHITLVCARWSSDAFDCYDVRPDAVAIIPSSPPPPSPPLASPSDDSRSSLWAIASVPPQSQSQSSHSLPPSSSSSSAPPPPPSSSSAPPSSSTPSSSPPAPSSSASLSSSPPSSSPSASSSLSTSTPPSTVGGDADDDADAGIVKMVVDVERLSELLLSPPPSLSASCSPPPTVIDDRITFRIDARGACSITSSRGGTTPLEWSTTAPSADESEPRERDLAHVVAATDGDLGLCDVDASRWWSYWRDLPLTDSPVVTQTPDAVRVETETKGAVDFRRDRPAARRSAPSSSSSAPEAFPIAVSCGEDRKTETSQQAPTAAAVSVTMSYGVVYALHPLAAYEFVATRLRIRCREDAPLRLGYDLDDVAGIAVAHTRALAHLDPSLPPVLVAVVRQYLPSRMRSSIDAFVAPLATH